MHLSSSGEGEGQFVEEVTWGSPLSWFSRQIRNAACFPEFKEPFLPLHLAFCPSPSLLCISCLLSLSLPSRLSVPFCLSTRSSLALSLHVPCHSQIPRYILTLHELLAHTPHEHVERNSLDYAKSKLEELSR